MSQLVNLCLGSQHQDAVQAGISVLLVLYLCQPLLQVSVKLLLARSSRRNDLQGQMFRASGQQVL